MRKTCREEGRDKNRQSQKLAKRRGHRTRKSRISGIYNPRRRRFLKKVSTRDGGKAHLGNIEQAAISGVEQGLTQLKYMDIKSQTDTATETLSAADAGKIIVIPNVGQDSVYSLPAPEVGLHLNVVGFGALAADGHDVSAINDSLSAILSHL